MTAETAELRTMSLADLATAQRKIAAELSRRLTGRTERKRIAKPDTWHAGSLDLHAEPAALELW